MHFKGSVSYFSGNFLVFYSENRVTSIDEAWRFIFFLHSANSYEHCDWLSNHQFAMFIIMIYIYKEPPKCDYIGPFFMNPIWKSTFKF